MGQLKKTDRKEIEYYLKKGYKKSQIGDLLGKHKSVIKREIDRNSVNGEYIAEKAHHKAYQRRYWVIKETSKIRDYPDLENYIEEKLKEKNPWTPQQIAERWNKKHSEKYGCKISHPTIYKFLRKSRLDLCKYLCTKRQKPKRRKIKAKKELIPNRTWIDDRPNIVAEKERLGDWEGDTIVSVKGDKTSILVLHDRASRFICVSKSCDKKSKRITKKVRKLLKDKPQETLSLDSGIEFRDHQNFGITTFFCHPYSSWEKGGVEYSNRLLRRHFPKKSELKNVSPKKLANIVQAINNTPRKCLDWNTPAEIFYQNNSP